jgi:hypothetical protein
MASEVLIEDGDGWRLPVEGWEITRFIDPAAFGLLIDGGTGDILRIYLEGGFALTAAGGKEAKWFPSDAARTAFAPLLELMGQSVDWFHVSESGQLTIRFRSNQSIEISPDPDYEAWEIEGLGRLMMICDPRGGVSRTDA